MRAGVWWGAAVLTVLALTSAQRIQANGTRTGRRLSAPVQNTKLEESDQNGEIRTSFRPRHTRRREETPPKEVTRTRTRSRPTAAPLETTPTPERNERFHSRRPYFRPTDTPVDPDTTKESTPSRASVIRNRSRQNYRRDKPSSTPASAETSSPNIDESKIEIVNSNLGDVSRTTPRQDISSTQLSRRSSISSTEPITSTRPRRINVRPTSRTSDLTVSGTTNSLTFTNKEQSTSRLSEDLRNSRKLRYRTRFSETDTNLTGEGITATVDATKSSQIKETTSQPETTFAPIVVESMQTSSEEVPVKTTTDRILKGVRRPLTRGKVSFKPSSPPKVKDSEEISEDDNYPASFKALIQNKNAATQPSSPPSESLSVKASEKSYKTYTSSVLPPDTITTKTKFSRLRSKNIGGEEYKNKGAQNENQVKTGLEDQHKSEKTEHKPRSFTPRTRKGSYATSTKAPIVSNGSHRTPYKFHRKLKITTESPNTESTTKHKIDTNNILKKTLSRPSYFSRKQGLVNVTETADVQTSESHENQNNRHSKPALPKTSYYTRSKNNKTMPDGTASSTAEAITEKANENTQTPAEKKNEDTIDMPLIFSLLKSPNNNNTIKVDIQDNKDSKEMFIIAVSSKESTEKSSENDVPNKNDSVKKEENVNSFEVNSKYHANYKGKSAENEVNETKETVKASKPLATPPIRNIQTRKSGQQRSKLKEQSEEVLTVTPKTRNSRKFSESYSKTTETTTNSITPEPEIHKTRFSSKYRASFNDKPYYKPTVPTVTPSTAWLKFFVTDHQLAKSVEEPYWFDEDLTNDVTTEMSRPITTPSANYESSIELVEGEEFHLGPDMNAISFTLPRSKLSSADLRLSESLMKPSQISNIEASQYSASVTVSIFDALAEILTSTPRTQRLSSTTEVKPKQNNNDIKQTLNGVSNSISVNNANSFNHDTFASNTDVSVVTKSVQTTVQTTQNVNNHSVMDKEISTSIPGGGITTAPLNTQPTPTSVPTTPVSARRPFAIKVLYSDTQTPTDPISTETQSTPKPPSTDYSSTVLNTDSDIFLTNNNLVSSQLTSMLSNNIRDLIQNMDETSRNKLSIDMAKLLRNLIPRALDGLKTINDDVDTGENTTPYSLEDIKDTENVNINNSIDTNLTISSDETLQTVETKTNVNSTLMDRLGDFENTTQDEYVNSTNVTPKTISSTLSSNGQMTIAETTSTTPSVMQITINESLPSVETATSSDTLNDNRLSGSTNSSIPLPFFTNAQIRDFTPTDTDYDETNNVGSTTQSLPLPLVTNSVKSQEIIEPDTPNLNSMSPAQLWVLSKKARVLQMIEDLIKQHHDEIATTPPLTEMLNQENNIPLSNRLTQILNTMTSTTETSDLSKDISTTPITTPLNPIPLSTLSSSLPSSLTTTELTLSTVTTPISELSPRLATVGADKRNEMSTETRIQSTTLSFAEETSTPPTTVNTETTTSSNTETTVMNVDITNMPSVDPTRANVNNTNSDTVSSNLPSISTSTIPKRDYVIFGILPNNTVVRKDPNDDILETITETSPYIIYSVLPNNTVIRRFPNGTRVPRFMQKIDVLPISPSSLKNPYSPIHNNPAIVRPRSNLIRVSTNTETPDINNGSETNLTNDNVNNQQTMIPTSALNIKDSSSFGVTTNRPPAEKSTASHVLSLRTSTMLPSVDEILLNSISSAVKEEMVISSMTSSTREPRILTLDIDPETKQIRTEKPTDGNGNAIFKFIPIDEVTTAPRESNVLKLAPKAPVNIDETKTMTLITETNTQSKNIDTSTTEKVPVGTPVEISSVISSISDNTESTISLPTATTPSSTTLVMTTLAPTTTESTTEFTTSSPTAQTTITDSITTTTQITTASLPTTTKSDQDKNTDDDKLLQNLLQATERNPKSLNVFSNSNQISISDSTTAAATKKTTTTTGISDEAKLLQAILAANQKQPNKGTVKTTTVRSIEDDIKQFEEDTKLLKALLAATGQNPANLNIPTLDNLNLPSLPSTSIKTTTTTKQPTTSLPKTTTRATTTQTVDDLRKLAEDAKFLQTLLQAGQNSANTNTNRPIISEIKPNVRIASNSVTTISTNPTTQNIQRPVYLTTTMLPETTVPSTTPMLTTLQTRTTAKPVATTTNFPRRRQTTTTARPMQATVTSRRGPGSGFTMTTEVPSTSTFSDAEDILFLQNLKSVLKTSPNPDDPEAALANRVIALAVERSLNEIQSGQEGNIGRTGKPIAFTTTTTTTTSTTTTPSTTTVKDNKTPSLADDIKQFEEDTKLLQALIKATGQDPSKFNIPTLPPNINTNKVSVQDANRDSKLIAFPSNLDQINPKPSFQKPITKSTIPTSPKPFGAKIAVKDDLKNVQDDRKLLKTLITLQGVQETTTVKSKIAITGQSPDEALNKLINRVKPANTMMSESTKTPVSIRTEYGKSNDALLAALLKEQGFGPTTASSLDEQLRLAALLNQVVVTPKARTTTPPPPPPPRRPVLDGLAWLWQQWRETGPGPAASRPNRRPEPSPSQSPASATSNRVSWFGSGPFVGNADDRPGNRVPLEPPRAVAGDQGPGRGQLVSAAINVTRAFSQFLGAAIQGAAQTFQSVFQAGQRGTNNVYREGSASG